MAAQAGNYCAEVGIRHGASIEACSRWIFQFSQSNEEFEIEETIAGFIIHRRRRKSNIHIGSVIASQTDLSDLSRKGRLIC